MAVLPMVERQRGVCCTPERRMPAERVEQLTEALKALSDPTRLEIVAILRDATEPVCVCDLTSTFDRRSAGSGPSTGFGPTFRPR
ncbi:MAG: helix-turn-helix transcriptional regulator [Chloroflexi bacterium]|nr:helix-turn-helix transcriptional regulator [Chloroflexota bacterium]